MLSNVPNVRVYKQVAELCCSCCRELEYRLMKAGQADRVNVSHVLGLVHLLCWVWNVCQ
jgi:hypothetical protein